MIDKECPTHGMLMIDLGEAPGEFDPRCLKCEIVRAAKAERELVTARAAANTWKEELTRLRAATAAPEAHAQLLAACEDAHTKLRLLAGEGVVQMPLTIKKLSDALEACGHSRRGHPQEE